MSKRNDDRKNVVIVGAGYAGLTVAKALVKPLDPAKYNLILIGPRERFVHVIAGLRMIVTDEGKLEDQALIPFDKLAGVTLKFGTVTSIEEKGPSNGEVVLQDGERLPYAALILATGSNWSEPLAVFSGPEETIRAGVTQWRKRFAAAKSVVIVGGGAVGIETAGEVRDAHPNTKVTIVHGDNQLLNSAYPAKFRKNIEGRVRARGINLVLGDYVDTFPEPGVVGVATRKGQKISDADFVFTAFGSRPNTSLAASLGSNVLDDSGFVKVKPTLELLGHTGIFALGDIISWREQKQAGKLLTQAPIVAANVASFLAGSPQKKLYKGSTELIIIPIGKHYGAGYADFLWGIMLGNWLSSIIKGRTLLIPMYRGNLGY